MAVSAANPPVRPRGRPRSARCNQAILDATLALLAEGGAGGTSVEAVAARAGVGKATIYRRWPNKESLIVDALAQLKQQGRARITGDLRADLVGFVEEVRRQATTTLAGRILPRLIADAAEHPALVQRYRSQVIAPRRAVIADMLRAGIARGELRADIDVDRALDLLVGPVLYRVLMRAAEGPVPRDLSTRIVDDVLSGLRPR